MEHTTSAADVAPLRKPGLIVGRRSGSNQGHSFAGPLQNQDQHVYDACVCLTRFVQVT